MYKCVRNLFYNRSCYVADAENPTSFLYPFYSIPFGVLSSCAVKKQQQIVVIILRLKQFIIVQVDYSLANKKIE